MIQLPSFIHSEAAKLAGVAIVASIVTIGAQKLYESKAIQERKAKLNQELHDRFDGDDTLNEFGRIPSAKIALAHPGLLATSALGASPALKIAVYNEELIKEQLARNYVFFGDDGMEKVRNGRVVIVGCGGVGSWAAIMLARTGIKKLRLIDFDYVTLSSLNRHATAVRADVGTPKVKSLQKMIDSIAPWIEVDTCVELWNIENEELNGWLKGADWVIDAIDNIGTKVDLLSYCHAHNVKVISSMGAGAKQDPSHIQFADISQTISDPLARSVRRRLRIHPTHPVHGGIPVVYSTEVPSISLLPLPEEEFAKGNVNELGPFDDFRVRILPVLGMLPAIFGMHVATYVVCEIAGKGIEEPLPVKGRKKLYEKLAKDLTAREAKFWGYENQRRLSITDAEVGYIFEELHRSKSSFPPFESLSKPTLIRWNFDEPLSVQNCVVMTPGEAEKHEAGYRKGLKPNDIWSDDIVEAVEKRRKEAKEWMEWVY